MPRYFLNQRTPTGYIPDPEGADFSTANAALAEAIKSAREIIADHVRSGQWPLTSQFEIANEEGQVVATLPFRSALDEEAVLVPSLDMSWINKGRG